MGQLLSAIKYRFCGECYDTYVLGVTGVEKGCDKCMGVIRNSAGWVVEDVYGKYYTDECCNVCSEDEES